MVFFKMTKVIEINPAERKDINPLELTGFNLKRDESDEAEVGTIKIETEIIEGPLEGLEAILFLEEDLPVARVISFDQISKVIVVLEIEFQAFFIDGLEFTLNERLQNMYNIIGLRSQDKLDFQSIENQKTLLAKLFEIVIPNRKELICKHAITSIHLVLNEGSDDTISHFAGRPKVQSGSELPKTKDGTELLHVATIRLSDFAQHGIKHLDEDSFISFYMRGDKWPEARDDFKVLYYKNGQTIQSSDSTLIDEEDNFDLHEVLEIPGSEHGLLEYNKFNEEELEKYENLKSNFEFLIYSPDKQGNKLFGYPVNIQGCVALSAELDFTKREYSAEASLDSKDWMLLLEVWAETKKYKFFDYLGNPALYFMIRKNDFENARFDQVQLVVQT